MSIKVLHIASFTGNIGDNASHNGLYRLLKTKIKKQFSITKLEIRKAYINYTLDDKWKWDQKLINTINDHDLTIVGGGNFFAPWIEQSHTGTTIDIPLQLINNIKKPLIFHGVGFDPYTNGYSKNTLDRFIKFIQKLSTNQNILIAVRNDGSSNHLKKLVPTTICNSIDTVPDSGFFIKITQEPLKELLNFPYIAINLAKDMIDKRFNSTLTYQQYLDELKIWIFEIKKQHCNFKFVLVPHIYSDIEAINDFIKLLPDMFIRENIIISPHIQGEQSENLFSIYKYAQLTIGNRFHTNVCSIGLNTPSIALVTYNKLYDLYHELNLDDRIIVANKNKFSKELIKLTLSTLKNKYNIKNRYKNIVESLYSNSLDFLDKIKFKEKNEY